MMIKTPHSSGDRNAITGKPIPAVSRTNKATVRSSVFNPVHHAHSDTSEAQGDDE